MYLNMKEGLDRAELRRMDLTFVPYVRRALAEGAYRGWLACTADGQIVAGGGLILHQWLARPHDYDPRRAYVLNVYTEPAYRRRGLARRIVTTIVEWCRQQGIARVFLHASRHGQPLYEAMGFEPTNEMRLKLDQKSG